MSTLTEYERCQLSDRVACVLEQAGLDVGDMEKVQDFVRDMVGEQSKVREVPEREAVKELVYWFENEADMDDLALSYSLIKTNYRIRITRSYGGGGSSDVFKDGERVEE
jgi:antirestriction protein